MQLTCNGTPVYCSISPCSWMYPHYGLQIQLSLQPNPVNASSEFVLDKHQPWDKNKDMDAAAKVLAEKWLSENGTAPLIAANDRWNKAQAEFEKKRPAMEARIKKRQETQDAKMKKKGYTHRIDGFIHPAQGDDEEITAFSIGEPSKVDLAALFKRCEMKTDYRITAL